jgi:[ribosomal protein S5]-alanine N-acetyltransferase
MPVNAFSPFPTLSTERLFLRQMCAGDADALIMLRADADIARYVDGRLAKSADEVRAFIDRISEGIALGQ